MKRILINVIFFFLLIACAQAESNPLSGLVIDHDKITGTVAAQFTGADGQQILQEIGVDCPVPAAIHANEIWAVTNRHITEESLAYALNAIGQSDEGTYSCTANSSRFSGNWDKPAFSDLSKADRLEQAIRIGLAYFEALDIDVDPLPRSVERPNDFEAYLTQTAHLYAHIYSDSSRYLDRLKAQWERTHVYETLAPNYTTVQFTVMVDGMHVWPLPAYPILGPEESNAYSSYAVTAYVTVSDSGILVEAGTSFIPEVLSRTQRQTSSSAHALNGISQFIAAPTWQDALCFALEHGTASSLIGNTEECIVLDNASAASITRYGSRSVITSITPYLYPVSKDKLTPVWRIECVSEYADGCRF